MKKKIAVLGDGVTGKATRAVIERLANFLYSPPEIAEWIVASPGIPPSEYPQVAGEIISEIEFSWRAFRRIDSTFSPQLIGVTGTNGKSTVSALLGHILECPVAGNFGTPLVTFVDTCQNIDRIVVELSSFQLERCVDFSPHVATILNLTEDHLDRHPTLESYATAKANICKNHTKKDWLILPDGDMVLGDYTASAKSNKKYIPLNRQSILMKQSKTLLGTHNHYNCSVVEAVLEVLNIPIQTGLNRMKTFVPLRHRLQWVATVFGRQFINDSKATNTDAVIHAIKSFKGPIHLILSGEDKGLDWARFLTEIDPLVSSVTVFGGLIESIQQAQSESTVVKSTFYEGSMESAVQRAYDSSSDGDVILFSPAGASFDLYPNYQTRGLDFERIVHKLKDRNEP